LGLGVLVCGILGGCTADKEPAQTIAPAAAPATAVHLTETQWSLENLGGKPVIRDSRATLMFAEVGKVAGNGSCNQFTGAAEIDGSATKLGPLASTRMACMGEASAQETEYLKALERAQRFKVKNGKLCLYVSGVDKPLVYRAAPESTWLRKADRSLPSA
jgi:heat shock protein HslJ